MRGVAVYCASVEKPSAETVTSRWLEPPQPRNSRGPQVREPQCSGSYSPRSRVCRLLPVSGWSQQYLTRIAVVPRGTSNGTITKLLLSSVPNSPVITLSGVIAAPLQGVASGAACADPAGTSRASATSAGRSTRSTGASLPLRGRRMRQERELPAERQLGRVDGVVIPARRAGQQRDRAKRGDSRAHQRWK